MVSTGCEIEVNSKRIEIELKLNWNRTKIESKFNRNQINSKSNQKSKSNQTQIKIELKLNRNRIEIESYAVKPWTKYVMPDVTFSWYNGILERNSVLTFRVFKKALHLT